MTITRFAPSPTGYIHVGNLRTALMNFLIARKAGGTFILRIDDTDPVRSKEEYVDALKEDLEWLGLTWDRIERQSERLGRYHEAAGKLRDMGRFYEAFETPTELDLKRKKQLNMGRPPVYDRAALALAMEGLAHGHYAGLASPWLKIVFGLPLGHCEGPDHLERLDLLIRLREDIAAQAPAELRPIYLSLMTQAHDVRKVIAAFGRHPHRNQALGRQSTPAEEAYIAEGRFPHLRAFEE